MKLETRNAIFSKLDSNYALIRDEDGEVLCLLGRDSDGYYTLYMEHYDISKEDAINLLDKCAGIALVPVVDNKVKNLYESSLEQAERNIEEQLKKLEDK